MSHGYDRVDRTSAVEGPNSDVRVLYTPMRIQQKDATSCFHEHRPLWSYVQLETDFRMKPSCSKHAVSSILDLDAIEGAIVFATGALKDTVSL